MTACTCILVIAVPALASAAWVMTPAAAQAGELAGVVELFTSQGCSSCPPADAELVRLTEEGEVLTLSYHVDYWNYLGWPDTLSSRANTERQYGYASTLKRNNVYTPQAVINGQDHVNGADGPAIDAMVDSLASSGGGLPVAVSAEMDADGLRISVAKGEGKADIVVVYFDDVTTVKITRGENAGRSVTYRHSVQDIGTVGMWSGEAVTLNLPASVMSAHPGRGCAVLLQQVGKDGAPGRILGAAVIEPQEPA
ncbi:hypothetical protein LL06_24755 [Hoeflea sp. BAL378]|uniref:DUF1223 domain-containing protein n=1 Tax=Hoeflea sp. BAL378 TaxID=1547437 RepID=UPI0005131DBF|nr:DUF1223 domain-containing protein [Hoeflea sp. BAL378]KGF67013.1 hypothetical protein LL06_24755 [Hoeflea sp. BAL378]